MKYTIGILAVVLVAGGIWYAISQQAVAPTASVTPTATPTTASGATTFTTAQVATHTSRASCYSIIRGEVYDLTAYIDKHPGGPQKILNICGKDGSSLFEDQHGGSAKQENLLVTFRVGVLAP